MDPVTPEPVTSEHSTPQVATTPHPDLTPDRVVALVLTALQRNDAPHPDAGVETLYAFASARLRAQVGDLKTFKRVLHNSLYAPLLEHTRARAEPLERRGRAARQTVVVWTAEAGAGEAPYLFSLAQQPQADAPPLWLLSALSRADLPG